MTLKTFALRQRRRQQQQDGDNWSAVYSVYKEVDAAQSAICRDWGRQVPDGGKEMY